MSNNGASYQKFDGNSGQYQEVAGNAPEQPPGGRKKLGIFFAVVAAAAVAFYYGTSSSHGKATAAVDKTLSESGNVKKNSNGKLQLFDSNRKSSGS
jgi:hypothetical protein